MPIIGPDIFKLIKTCDVCRLLDNDLTEKPGGFCNLCDSWICEKDMNRWGRRLKAALKRKLEPYYKGMNNYEEIAIPDSIQRDKFLKE